MSVTRLGTYHKQKVRAVAVLNHKVEPSVSRALSLIWIIFICNILDALFTYSGVSIGYLAEANSLMQPVMGSIWMLLLFKICIPSGMLFAAGKLINAGSIKKLSTILITLGLVCFVYLSIVLVHIVLLAMVLNHL